MISSSSQFKDMNKEELVCKDLVFKTYMSTLSALLSLSLLFFFFFFFSPAS